MNTRKRKSEYKKPHKFDETFSLKLEHPGPIASKWFSRPSEVRASFNERTPQREFVQGLDNWSMDVIALGENVQHPLPLMFSYLIETNELMDLVSNVVQLENFLLAIESNYRLSNPYHNALHAADVLFSVFWILRS